MNINLYIHHVHNLYPEREYCTFVSLYTHLLLLISELYHGVFIISYSLLLKVEYEKTSIKSIDLCHKLHVQYFCGLMAKVRSYNLGFMEQW